MTDVTTNRKIVVSTDGDAGPYLIVPVSQLGASQKLLSDNRIPHWIDDDAISLDGKAAIGVVNLGHSCDPKRVQTLLDAVS